MPKRARADIDQGMRRPAPGRIDRHDPHPDLAKVGDPVFVRCKVALKHHVPVRSQRFLAGRAFAVGLSQAIAFRL